MNELRQALLPGEEIIFETRKHWMAPIRDSMHRDPAGHRRADPVAACAARRRRTLRSHRWRAWHLMWWIGLGAFVVGIGWIVWNIVAWMSANFGVSNKRVLCYEGLLRKHSSETLLSLDHRRQADRAGPRWHVRLRRPDDPDRVGRGGQRQFHDHQACGRLPDRAPDGTDQGAHGARAAGGSGRDRRAGCDGHRHGDGHAGPGGVRGPGPRCRDRARGPRPGSQTSEDAAASLQRLADLHARGVITDAEFEAKKAELLGRI